MTVDGRSKAIAELIVGKNGQIEDWLISGLERAAAAIAWSARKEDEHPSREELRTELQDAAAAATLLRQRLTETTFQRVLAASSKDDVNADQQVYHGLESLIDRINAALAAIPVGSTPHRSDPGTNTPYAVCALAVCTAWRAVRGRYPPHTPVEPQTACRLLWEMAGQEPVGWSPVPTGWRVHLRKAKKDLEHAPQPQMDRLFAQPTD